MTNLLVFDTADAVMKRKSDGEVFVTAETQLASLTTSLGINEKIFGGIGNKPLAVMKGQKEVTSTLRNAFYNKELLAITQGVSVEEGTHDVYKRENGLKVVDNEGTLEVTITGTPVGTTAYVTNTKGETEPAAITSKVVTIPTGQAVEGESVAVSYQIKVTGKTVPLDSQAFGEAYEIEYHTIAYDPETNQVVKDIYIQLDHVVPSSDFELSFENGTPIAPEITFDALAPANATEIGRIVEVNRG
ncbi:hypothetical protein LCM23_14570 [Cytobacillus kochii]|uniref:hypothetical protein n=1 Tax=Cytobacillus kochii TaxID=859143 RepID=UPI001CD45C63|nr:hypothetical protein [Cytobacillus kochii]MCA1027322.1 hypothetical protein [Cytobacillus kochii]